MELLIFLLFIAFVVWTINKIDKNKSTTKNNPETTNPKKPTTGLNLKVENFNIQNTFRYLTFSIFFVNK